MKLRVNRLGHSEIVGDSRASDSVGLIFDKALDEGTYRSVPGLVVTVFRHRKPRLFGDTFFDQEKQFIAYSPGEADTRARDYINKQGWKYVEAKAGETFKMNGDDVPPSTPEALPVGTFRNAEGTHTVASAENFFIHETRNPNKPPIDRDAPAAANIRRAEVWLDDNGVLYELAYGPVPSKATLATVISLLPATFKGKRVTVTRLQAAKL